MRMMMMEERGGAGPSPRCGTRALLLVQSHVLMSGRQKHLHERGQNRTELKYFNLLALLTGLDQVQLRGLRPVLVQVLLNAPVADSSSTKCFWLCFQFCWFESQFG
ncbi:hypothetical protein ILYODFUR_032705 [Ilyodon furcidens]|uniref:Uncharacterized protein n=1 Tax=Ilyodon furcidens TaxID=33524 RepID=A0ABV0T3M4_9TELE